MSALRKGLLSPEEFGILSETLLCRHEELMGDIKNSADYSKHSKTFPILDDDHMAAVLFAEVLAGGKKGFHRYNQNVAGTIISVSAPGTDVLQKTVVRVKLLCGVGECSSSSVWVLASARKQL